MISRAPGHQLAPVLDDRQLLAFLAEASALLSESLEPATIYRRLARLVIPALAERCVIVTIDEAGALHHGAAAHVDPAAEAALRELCRRAPPSVERRPDYARAILRAEPVLGDDGPAPAIIAPLIARGRTLGLIELGLAPPGRAYGPADLPAVRELARRAALAADNAHLYAEARAAEAALRDANRDLEARVTARTAELGEAAARFRAAMDSSLDSIYFLRVFRDEAGQVVDFTFADLNRRALEALRELGRTREQLIGQRLCELLPVNRTGGFFEKYLRVYETGEPLEEEFALDADRPAPGAWRHHRVVPLPDGVAINSRDVSDQRRAEAARRESEERFRRAFDDAAVGMSIVAVDGRWVKTNQAICTMLGYRQDELLALHYQQITHPDDHAIDADVVARLLSGEIEAGHVEKRYLHRDGHIIWALMSISLLRDDEGRPAFFLSQKQDITARKEAETALVALNRRLELSNRELQDFASVASHDLQEPLRKIQAFGDRLRTRYADSLDASAHDYLARVLSAAQRMQALINDLLSFSRVSTRAQPFVPIDLAAVAAEVVGDLEAQIERTGGQVEILALPTLEADPLQMRQLLQNLLSNALKFHREGVPPHVRVWGEARDARGAPAAMPDEHRIYVADNGIGFAEKYLDRIFTVFQRLHGREQYEGTGIGLAICRRIVERHGGTITAESAPGRGATFIITLPARQP